MNFISFLIKLNILLLMSPIYCFSQTHKIELITTIDTTFSNNFKLIKYYDTANTKYSTKTITIIDTNLTERKVGLKFKSRKGSTIKKLLFYDTTYQFRVNNVNTYVMQLVFEKSEWQNYINVFHITYRLINTYGQIKWSKYIKTYSRMDTADHPFDYWLSYDISDSSGTAYIQYRDSTENYYIDVIDTTGKYLLKAHHTSAFDNIQLSCDGSLIVVDTWMSNDEYNRDNYYFICDLVKSRSKYIRSKSRNDSWEFKIEPRGFRTIRLYNYDCTEIVDTLINYDDIPSDLSIFIR